MVFKGVIKKRKLRTTRRKSTSRRKTRRNRSCTMRRRYRGGDTPITNITINGVPLSKSRTVVTTLGVSRSVPDFIQAEKTEYTNPGE
jgi:hypothetical protein